MTRQDLTLEELSERTGVEARTLRSWISEGLLARPLKPGRGARYPASNTDRALAVRFLKDTRRLPLSEIRRRFMTAGEDKIREWALKTGSPPIPPGSAREYLHEVETRGGKPMPADHPVDLADMKPALGTPEGSPGGWGLGDIPLRQRSLNPGVQMPDSDEDQTDLPSIAKLIVQLATLRESPAPRHSKGTPWTRISITPDFEISIRGDLEPHERALFEQLADHIHAILTGRLK